MRTKDNGKGGNFDTRANVFGQIRKNTVPSWAECARLGLALDRCIGAGCAIILGATRDGGALVITVLDGDSRHKTYCSSSDELEEAISALEDMYTEP